MIGWKHVVGRVQGLLKNLIIINVFMVGCASSPPYFVHPKTGAFARQCDLPQFVGASPSVPPRLRPMVRDSFLYWNEAVGKRFFVYTDDVDWEFDDKKYGGVIVVSVDPSYKRSSAANTNIRWLGNGCMKDSFITVNPKSVDMTTDAFQTLMRHEVGHLLGLRHRDLFTELMSPTTDTTFWKPQNASEEEIRLVRELYGVK